MLATELEKHEYTAVPGTCGRLAGASAPERVEAPGRQVAPIARQRGATAWPDAGAFAGGVAVVWPGGWQTFPGGPDGG